MPPCCKQWPHIRATWSAWWRPSWVYRVRGSAFRFASWWPRATCARTGRPVYTMGHNRRFWQRYPREGLTEDTLWSAQLSPLLRDVPRNVLDIAHHGATEMINNAIDHSEATHVGVHMELRDNELLMMIADDGVGIFRKIARALELPDERLALLELSKGKFTTD